MNKKPMKKYKIAVLDDYQNAALERADWSVLRDRADIAVFQDHIADPDAVAELLLGKVDHFIEAQIACLLRLCMIGCR